MKRVPFKMEFIFRASPAILYKFLTTPSCLVRWFCDKVDINGNVFTFEWDDTEEQALIVEDIEDELLRFHWMNAPQANEYFELRITESPITNETILVITDYANADEVDEMRKLWESQIKQLQIETGG